MAKPPHGLQPKSYTLICAKDVIIRPIDWVWEGHLMRGALELMTGIPGLGKSQVHRDFRNDPDDPSKKERYQAEALVHKHLPVDALSGLVCYNDDVLKSLNAALAQRNRTMTVVKKPDWYF